MTPEQRRARHRAMSTLHQALVLFPELRIMQLLCNALPNGDQYYATDAKLDEYLREYISRMGAEPEPTWVCPHDIPDDKECKECTLAET